MSKNSENFEELLKQDAPILAGILNITPNSFSDGGKFIQSDDAIKQGRALLADGASIIDIGGESTGPGTKPISGDEEWNRIESAIVELSAEHIVSVDTYKSEVATRAIKHGATIINDVSGLRADESMASIIAEHGAYVVIMHSKEDGPAPHATSSSHNYQDVIKEISEFLRARIDYAINEGISKEKIIIDPGMGGFLSTDPKVSWEVLERLDELYRNFSDYPLLIGASRKGFLGGKLEERDAISQLVHLRAAESGAKILRTHDVRMARDFSRCWKLLQGNS